MKRAALLAAMFFAVGACVAYGQASPPPRGGDGCSILSKLNAEFRKRNPNIAHVRIVDVRPTLTEVPKYLVLGWGIRADRTFRGNFEDELFGLFLVDESLSEVEKVMDFIPTPRWLDAEMRIRRLNASEAVLEATGETYGGSLLRRKYDMSKEGRTRGRAERRHAPTRDTDDSHVKAIGRAGV